MMLQKLRALFDNSGSRSEVEQRIAFETILRQADAARDTGDLALAIRTYQAAFDLDPSRHHLLVQIGNMKKDSGVPRAALAVYRKALDAGFHRADVWVQISRCHYMMGDVAKAISACEKALELEPGNEDALSFLIERGRAALQEDRVAAIEAGGHAEPLVALAEEVGRLAKALEQVQRELPSRAQFAYTPHQAYDGFRKRFLLPNPPTAPEGQVLNIVFDCEGATGSDLRRLRASLQGQTSDAWRLYVLGGEADPDIETLLTADPKTSRLAPGGGVLQAGPVLHLCGAAGLSLNAVVWLICAASEAPNHLVQIDEVETEPLAGGEDHHFPPGLYGLPDFDHVCETGIYPSGLLWPGIEPYCEAVIGDWRATYLQALRGGGVACLPLPLIHTPRGKGTGGDAGHLDRVRALLGGDALVSQGEADLTHIVWPTPRTSSRIDVIIPTKDNPDLLEAFVTSLLDTASDPRAVRISIIDNASQSEAALAAHARLADRLNVEVWREPGPFNWSKMNNDAAARTMGDILVFANDDMVMLSKDWDAEIRSVLARDRVGVLGAMLLYPDGDIQHAGICLGWRGGAIHEGLAWGGDQRGPSYRWASRRRVSAVTGAFLATSRDLFDQLEGFDQVLLPIGGSDLDFAFKARAAGMAVMWTPHIRMTHHESLSRGQDHADDRKRRRNDDENAVLQARWGAKMVWDPHIHPLWADFGRPFQHVAPINQEKAIAYLKDARTTDAVAN